LITITAAGAESRIIHRWSDVVGQKIVPVPLLPASA
jgi:hypothetical protein